MVAPIAFCVKCRTKREMLDARIIINKRKVSMRQGKCKECGKTINTFIPKRASTDSTKSDPGPLPTPKVPSNPPATS